MKRLFIVLILSGIALARTDFFSLQEIASLDQIEPPFQIKEIDVFSQPYHFFSQGRQTYVFLSEDGKYVLKFFKRSYYAFPWYTKCLPKKWRQKEINKREKRKRFYLQGYKIAWEEMPEKTALLYVQLGKSEGPSVNIQLLDRLRRGFSIDLSQVSFVLQKKGEPLFPTLLKIYEQEGMRGVERILDQFILYLKERIGKKIVDTEQNIRDNFGILDGNILYLDPGRYQRSATLSKTLEWERNVRQMRRDLKRQIPEAVFYFEKKLQEISND